MKRNSLSYFLYVVFRKDIGRKAMALLLAMILWVYLDQKVVLRKERLINIQVVEGENEFYRRVNQMSSGYYIVLPPNLMLVENLEDKRLSLWISGTKELIQGSLLGRRDLYESVMEGRDHIKKSLYFTRDDFEALKNRPNTKVSFAPDHIQLHIALRDSAKIFLSEDNLVLEGEEELAERGITKEGVTYDRSFVTIEGPKHEVEKIRQDNSLLKFESLSIRKAGQRPIEGNLKLSEELLDNKVTLGRPNLSVQVTITFSEKKLDHILEDVDVAVRFRQEFLPPEELSKITMEPNRVRLILRGPRSQIDLLTEKSPEALKEKILVYIDFSENAKSIGKSWEEFRDSGEVKYNYLTRRMVFSGFFDPSIEIEVEPAGISVKEVESE